MNVNLIAEIDENYETLTVLIGLHLCKWMFLHAIKLGRKGLKQITIMTVNTDVVVIALNSLYIGY